MRDQMLASLGTNISANSLSAGNDLTALLPRYINIRRGQVICAVIGGWVMCPWEILATSVPSRPPDLSALTLYTTVL